MATVVLGGTGFLSGAVVQAALARGHDVVAVTRGRSGTPPEEVRSVVADRDDAAALRAALADVDVEAVIDVCGYTVAGARAVAEALGDPDGGAGGPGRSRPASYVYVSSISAYRDWPPGPVRDEADPTFGPDADHDVYGPMKAESERVLGAALGERLLSVRAGLIIGPGDRTRRLSTWLHRFATREHVVVPAEPDVPVAFVDVRDLAGWLVDAADRRLSGAVNATGPQGMTTYGGMIDACREAVRASGGRAGVPVPVTEADLLAAGVEPWVDLPFWLPAETAATAWQVGTDRARALGLPTRPIAESVADTWDWVQRSGFGHPEPDARQAALFAALESER